jgi:amidohydrolase
MDTQQLTDKEHKLLKELRHHLHQHPEVSHEETNTAKYITSWAKKHLPSFELMSNAGGAGFMLTYNSGNKGLNILFRAELDALPITENNPQLDHQSTKKGTAHLCGHDGHMTMICGLGLLIERELPKKGSVALLFQPAEETGEGADMVTKSEGFKAFKPDIVYALHNLPGEPLGDVLVKSNTMCLASTGLWLHLKGKTSHAAEPFTGKSPLRVFEPLLPHLQFEKTDPLRISTLVHMQLGKPAFGTTPGDMSIALTIRAETDDELNDLVEDITSRCEQLTNEHGIEWSIERTEHFSAVINNEEAVQTIRHSAKSLNRTIQNLNEPMRWSEDVGVLLNAAKGALFCLGSGSDTPALHHPTYDFPDELTPIGSELFHRILVNTMKETT